MSRESVVALKESLEKKLKILKEIQRIGNEQTALLKEEELDYETFDELMDSRDVCLENLNVLDRGFELVYDKVKGDIEANKSLYSDLISEVKVLIGQITELTVSIQAMDERNKKMVSDAFVKDRRGLGEAKRSVSVAYNYYKSMSGVGVDSSRFMDKKK